MSSDTYFTENVENMRTSQISSYIEVDYKSTQVLLTNCEKLGVQVCEKLDYQVIIKGDIENGGRHFRGKGKGTPSLRNNTFVYVS